METVAVIFGGRSAEHDVSIVTALASIIKPLELTKKYRVEAIYIAKDGAWYWDEKLKDIKLFTSGNIQDYLHRSQPASVQFDGGMTLIKSSGIAGRKQSRKINVVFPAMHGTYGEDGALMGLLDMAGIPYVGCGVGAAAIAMDKVLAKQVASANNIPVSKFLAFTKAQLERSPSAALKDVTTALKYPLFIKPAHLGSSIGISRATNDTELRNALEVAAHYDDRVIVEEAVNNLIEVTLPIMGNSQPQPALLERPMTKPEDFFDFETKYLQGGKKGGKGKGGAKGAQGYSQIPAELPSSLTELATSVGLAVYSAFGCSGIARVDMLIDEKSGKVYFNEVNPLPGGLYAHNWNRAGVSNVELVQKLIGYAKERHAERQALTTSFNTNYLQQFEVYLRVNIVHPDSGELHYEIRGIIDFAEHLQQTGIDIIWENIGDPVAKGEQIPEWIRDIVADAAKNDMSAYGYSPTQGLDVARNYLSETRSRESNVKLAPDDILFFNGLGDAITTIYTWLNPNARVLGPNPAYPTHSSLEAVHSGAAHLTYSLNPDNGWLPDIEDVRSKVANNPDVAALLIINPDNPTGMVYPRHILEAFVDIAKEYNLFLIADEIYANLTYNPEDFISLATLANKVPTIIMRGLSKEIPWPGSRCGWVEFCYIAEDPDFARYAQAIEEAKMTEVCSTTLPQAVLPKILGDERYMPYVRSRCQKYAERAAEARAVLGSHPLLKVVEPKGAFYLSVAFSDEFLQGEFTEPAANPFAQKLLDVALEDIPESDFDKRFCYQLMACTGVCVVPLSTGFNSDAQGFRMTLLEADDAAFTRTLQMIKDFCS